MNHFPDVLRDPIWQGISAVIGIVGAIFAVLFFVSPSFKHSIEAFFTKLWQKKRFLYSVAFLLIFFLGMYIGNLSPAISSPTPTETEHPGMSPTFVPTLMPDGDSALFVEEFEERPSWASAYHSVSDGLLFSKTDEIVTPIIGNNAWKNYSVRLNMNYSIDYCTKIFIQVRIQDPENYMAYECQRSKDLFVCSWLKSVDGNLQQIPDSIKIYSAISSPITVDADRDNNYRIQFSNLDVEPFVDNDEPHFTNGAFRLSVYGPVAVDDIAIRKLP